MVKFVLGRNVIRCNCGHAYNRLCLVRRLKGKNMAGTRTAPLFTAAATSRRITLHLVDASGDTTTETHIHPAAEPAADIEAWLAAYQAASNASLYKVTEELVREGDLDPDNADATELRTSVEQGINIGFKNITTGLYDAVRLVAPINAVMQGNQDIPLMSAAEAAAVVTAFLAATTGFNARAAQYTARTENAGNPKVKL